MGRREHALLFIPLKPQIFIPPKIGGNGIKFNEFFTKTPKIPLYIQLFILKYESNSNIVIKWYHSIPSILLPNKITYIPFIFIPFRSFVLKHPIKVNSIAFYYFPFFFLT